MRVVSFDLRLRFYEHLARLAGETIPKPYPQPMPTPESGWRSMKARRRYLTPTQKARIVKQQNSICWCGCNERLGCDPREIEFHHKHGLEAGGSNDLDNYGAVIRLHHKKISAQQTGVRAKIVRIAARDGMRLAKLSAKDRVLAKMLENRQ